MRVDKEILKFWGNKPNTKKWKRATPCGHHYPYFLRWFDDWSESGKMIERHCYCFVCEKEYIIRLHPKHMVLELMEFGYDKGRETIAKIRKNLPKTIRRYKKDWKRNHLKGK